MENKENGNKKILKFSAKPVKTSNKKEKIGNFNGYEYIKTDKDLNGMPFIKESLIEYSLECKYIIRVMREKDKKIFLYNYYVQQEDLGKFFIKFENGEYDGQIIEVEKYIPEDLA